MCSRPHLALTRLGLDRVWWLATPGNPLKSSADLAALRARIDAAQALVHDPRIAVTGFESEIGSRYTADTLALSDPPGAGRALRLDHGRGQSRAVPPLAALGGDRGAGAVSGGGPAGGELCRAVEPGRAGAGALAAAGERGEAAGRDEGAGMDFPARAEVAAVLHGAATGAACMNAEQGPCVRSAGSAFLAGDMRILLFCLLVLASAAVARAGGRRSRPDLERGAADLARPGADRHRADRGLARSRGRKRRRARKAPAVVYLHGCSGLDEISSETAGFLAAAGYVVFSPDSFARAGRPASCNVASHEGSLYRGALALRHAEAAHAVAQVRRLPFVDPRRVYLYGFSEGAAAAATVTGVAVTARVVEGWTCHAGWPEYAGLRAPASQPTLTLTSRDDPWFQAEWARGDCGAYMRGRRALPLDRVRAAGFLERAASRVGKSAAFGRRSWVSCARGSRELQTKAADGETKPGSCANGSGRFSRKAASTAAKSTAARKPRTRSASEAS